MHGYSEGPAIYLAALWGYPIFLAAGDCESLYPQFHFPWSCSQITVVMILRVYAMWHQSKSILYSLLFIFVLQIIVSLVFAGIYYNPNTHFSGVSQASLWTKLESHASGP